MRLDMRDAARIDLSELYAAGTDEESQDPLWVAIWALQHLLFMELLVIEQRWRITMQARRALLSVASVP